MIILQKKHLEEVSRIRSVISYLAVLLRYCWYLLSLSTLFMFFFLRYWLLKQSFCSRCQLKLRVLANKPLVWPLMVLEEFLKLNALRWILLQKVTPSSTSLVQLFFQTSTMLKFLLLSMFQMVIWLQAQLLLSQLLLVLQLFLLHLNLGSFCLSHPKCCFLLLKMIGSAPF